MSLRSTGATFLAALAACSASPGGKTPQPPAGASDKGGDLGGDLIFTGMCDASAAVALSETVFAVADDEDNVLRVYDARRGGAPLSSVDISDGLGLPVRPRKNPNKPPKPPPETDIEAATRLGDRALWITSHGRNSSGKLKSERLLLFGTTAPAEPTGIKVVGAPYENLLADLLADTRFSSFNLAAAAERAPKDPGGLNIEGLTERAAGGVFVGFRNPTPGGKALLVVLLNPLEVIRGQPVRLGEPVLLDLGGLGVRSLSFWRGRYLIVAGHYADALPSRLYRWDGQGTPEWVDRMEFKRLNPEGFFTPESLDKIMVLSDDGSLEIDGVACKRLKDHSRKRFRGVWLTLPARARPPDAAP
jgi:hypothetical protein